MGLTLIKGRYRIIRTLQSDPTVTVFQVEDQLTSSILALKLIPTTVSPDQVSRLKNEYLQLSQLAHPFIVRPYKLETCTDFGHFFSMQFAGYHTLSTFPHLTCEYAILVLIKIGLALDYLHSRSILHRDVSPDNILIEESPTQISGDHPQISLIDFDLAGPPTTNARITGTMPFIAPELQRGREDPRSDIYSLGRTLREVLAKNLRNQESNEQLIEILDQMTHPNPDMRPNSMNAVIEALPNSVDYSYDLAHLRSYFSQVPLQGRDEICDAFHHSLSQENGTSKRVFIIGGETGIGKSRLLNELQVHSQLVGIATATIECKRHGPDNLTELSIISDRDQHSTRLPDIKPSPSSFPWHLQNLTSTSFKALGDLQGRHVGNNSQRLEALHGLAHNLLEVSKHQQLLLSFENLNFADLETLELIRLLASQPCGPLIVATYQSDNISDSELPNFLRFLSAREATVHIQLDRFTLKETTAYVSFCLDGNDDTSELASMVHELTDGNPLLVQESLVSLAKAGKLRHGSCRWERSTQTIEGIELPNTLIHFAETQLRSVDPRHFRILETLTALDAPVSALRLSVLTGRTEASIREDLESLVGAGLLIRLPSDDFPLYAFRYRCTRERLYDGLSSSRKRNLHSRIAEALQGTLPNTAEGVERIAHHYVEAMDRIHGPEFAFRAGCLALERFSTDRAIEWLVRGLNLLPSDEVQKRFEGLELVGTLLVMTGELVSADRFYREMLLLARTASVPAKEALAVREIARILIENGDTKRGLEYAEQAETIYGDLGDAAGRIGATVLRSLALHRTGESTEAADSAAKAYSEAASIGDIYGQSLARNIQGLIACDRAQHEKAIEFQHEALQLKSQINDVTGIAVTRNNIGIAFLGLNRLREAKEHFETGLSDAREKGLSLAATLASTNLGEICLLLGDLRNANSLFCEAMTLAEGANRKYYLSYILYSIGLLNLGSGTLHSARDYLNEASALNAETGSLGQVCAVLTAKAELLLEVGRVQDAREAIERALSIGTEIENPQTLAWARSVAIAVDLECGAMGPVRVRRGELEEARKGGRKQVLLRLLEARARLLLAEDRPERVLSCLEEMKSIARESDLRPELSRIALMEGRALLKLQRKVEARLVLEKGALAAREMGLRPLLTRLLYWLSQAQEAEDDRQGAADSLFEAEGLINTIAQEMKDDPMRESYLAATTNVVIFQRVEYLRKAGVRPRGIPGGDPLDPELVAAEAFEEIKRSVGADVPLRTLLTAVLDKAIQTIRADRGLVILLDPPAPEVTIARDLEGETIQDATDYCRTILEDVTSGQAILAIDASEDERFRQRRSIALYDIRSLMCLPLKLGESVLGALYFDSRSNDRLFKDEDLHLMKVFSERVTAAIADAQEAQRQRERTVIVNREFSKKYHPDNLIGDSPPMRRLGRMMEAVIRADCNVLVTGESGTGKELVARAIHYAGSRKLSNFVPVDCGAIPENLVESELFGYVRGAFSGADLDKRGLFEEAANGTLFLDEVTNTTPSFQAKLLRALQSGEFRRLGETRTRRVDVRIIAATNADIDQAIKNGEFREDLYYRLNVVTLSLPPLRERREDILPLAEHFARGYCAPRGIRFGGIDRGALARLGAYSWPGNVRELRHAIEAALVLSGDGVVRRRHLPERILGGDAEHVRDLLQEEAIACNADGGATPDEKALLIRALEETGGDKSRAARLLGWNRMRLYRRMKSLGIPPDTGKTQDPTGSV